jgi:hypothetical protein
MTRIDLTSTAIAHRSLRSTVSPLASFDRWQRWLSSADGLLAQAFGRDHLSPTGPCRIAGNARHTPRSAQIYTLRRPS